MSRINESLKHHVPEFEMENEQTLGESSIIISGTEVLNSNEHFSVLLNATDEEDASICMEPVYDEESSCCSLVLKSEVTYDSAFNQYDIISLPEASSFSDYIPPDLDIDISIKDDNGVNESMYSECGKYLLPLQKVKYARKDVQ